MNYNIPNKRVIQQRANFIYTWLINLKSKAKKNNAVIFFEGSPVNLENVIVSTNYCGVKYSEFYSTTLFDRPECDELLESSIKVLKKWLEDNFKLYKEIKI